MKVTATCKNPDCQKVLFVKDMTKVQSFGHNYFYVCPDCVDREYNYSAENGTISHKPKKHGDTFSLELETSDRTIESNLMYEYGFLPTSDGSIGGTEWKTKIYLSLNGIKQLLRSIEKIALFGYGVGTHTNIGNVKLTPSKIQSIRDNYVKLFKPLSDYLESHYDDTLKVFGRDFTGYAQSIDEYTDAMTHENFINLQHSTHIEFRLFKFINAEQMFAGIQMSREMVNCVMTNYCEYLNQSPLVLERKINITANKLVSIFQKYAKKAK